MLEDQVLRELAPKNGDKTATVVCGGLSAKAGPGVAKAGSLDRGLLSRDGVVTGEGSRWRGLSRRSACWRGVTCGPGIEEFTRG